MNNVTGKNEVSLTLYCPGRRATLRYISILFWKVFYISYRVPKPYFSIRYSGLDELLIQGKSTPECLQCDSHISSPVALLPPGVYRLLVLPHNYDTVNVL